MPHKSDDLDSPATGSPGARWPWLDRPVWLWGPVGAYAALIFGLSSLSDVSMAPSSVSDKSLHAWLYAGFGLLVVRALARGDWRRIGAGAVAATVAIATVYGLSDETHQLFVPNRQFDLKDLAADAAGAALAAGLAWAWGIIRRHSSTP